MRMPLAVAVTGIGVIMAACASSGTAAGKPVHVDDLSSAQRSAALLSPGEVPEGRGCAISAAAPPTPERVLDVDAYRAALDRALTGPPVGDAVLSVGSDSTGKLTRFRVVRASLPDSVAKLLATLLEEHLRPLVHDGHRAGWHLRMKIVPAAADDLVRVARPVSCGPRLRNRYAVSQRIDDALARHPNVAKLPDRQRTTQVWLRVGRDGRILESEVHRTSGRIEVDRIALDAVSVAVFDPALLDGEPVELWVNLPIIVRSHGRGAGGDRSPPCAADMCQTKAPVRDATT